LFDCHNNVKMVNTNPCLPFSYTGSNGIWNKWAWYHIRNLKNQHNLWKWIYFGPDWILYFYIHEFNSRKIFFIWVPFFSCYLHIRFSCSYFTRFSSTIYLRFIIFNMQKYLNTTSLIIKVNT
jgi:hypothetical protein